MYYDNDILYFTFPYIPNQLESINASRNATTASQQGSMSKLHLVYL